jgi:hypothetical protein
VVDAGTIPFEVRGESAAFLGAAWGETKDGSDGYKWWYVNSWSCWALSWGTNFIQAIIMEEAKIETPRARHMHPLA